ncbi:alkaline phosphatase synthesis transcriptional regulatory protein PhoP [Ligilactobacillus murinus DSM 20452 = NBRC 14221]|uniref:Alkaline phosphatase synthesis transcriptional regulatory protein PhoP n=1 Tax=Ligilactobacillus murinus DSM 20452 = NBRC 14221 TaxID=1423772 RepID=A0A0R2BBE1_9LACO|nr:alkaline phosphatase synthesis transcriptional regulatory protein PhoP [Ligilactobacillus murinus DSM 20452 = NBRC 14221]
MNVRKVLVVEDDTAIKTLLKYNLEQAGYQTTTSSDGQAGYELALNNEYDFILLDVMLPNLDGLEITKRLRQEKVMTPILIITARDQELDKIIGLELGADDYLTKPFSPREVIARLKAISRRITPKEVTPTPKIDTQTLFKYPDFTVDLERVKVMVKDQTVALTPKEFELLAYFIKRPGRVLSREKLLNGVWGYDYVGQTRMIDMHVSHLREKLEPDPKKPKYIETLRGFGYRFNGEPDD